MPPFVGIVPLRRPGRRERRMLLVEKKGVTVMEKGVELMEKGVALKKALLLKQ